MSTNYNRNIQPQGLICFFINVLQQCTVYFLLTFLNFSFSVPVSCAPRKLNLDLSPPKSRAVVSPVKPLTTGSSTTTTSSSSPVATSSPKSEEGRRPFRKFSSLKGDEEDTMLMDLMSEMTTQEDLPTGFSNLLSAPTIHPSTTSVPSSVQAPARSVVESRPCIRRCLSMMDSTPTSSRVILREISEVVFSLVFKI